MNSTTFEEAIKEVNIIHFSHRNGGKGRALYGQYDTYTQSVTSIKQSWK